MPETTPPLAYLIRERTAALHSAARITQAGDDPAELAVRAAAPLLTYAARLIARSNDPVALAEQLLAWPLQPPHLDILVAELTLIAPDRVEVVHTAVAETQTAAGYSLTRRQAHELEIGDILLDLGPDVSGHVVGREFLMDGRLLFHLHLTDRRSNGPLTIMVCALARPDDLRVIADPEAL